MIKVVNRSLLAITVSGILASPAVYATNGYFSHGFSTKEKGLAGAGAALSQDSMAAATNPAGMAFVGERMDIGLQLFSPSPRGYTVTGNMVAPGGVPPQGDPNAPFGSAINAAFDPATGAATGTTYESDNDLFLIPHFGYNWQLNNDSTIGVSVYGNGGMNTEYPASSTPDITGDGVGDGTFGAGTAGISLAQLFVNTTFAKKINDKHAFGGSLILVGQRFIAQGLESFGGFSSDPNNLSGNVKSDSFGAGLKFGYQGEVAKGIRLGVSYQSKIDMSEYDEYAGLFAEGGDFDIPSTWTIGASFDVGASGVIVADVQQINYSDVASIGNPVNNLLTNCIPAGMNPSDPTAGATGEGCLGGSAGGGFGWEDMTIFKIGYQIDVSPKHTIRVGYSHADQPIPESETFFNVLAPAVIEDHFTAGWTMKVGNNQEFNLAAMYAPSNSVKGQNPMDANAASGGTQIEIEMAQFDIQAGWAWKF
jgi:long-chain fatty acid transport protein